MLSRENYVKYPANLVRDLLEYYAKKCEYASCREYATVIFHGRYCSTHVCDKHLEDLRLENIGSTYKEISTANLVHAAEDFCKTQEMLT